MSDSFSENKRVVCYIAAILCIVGCITDIILIRVFGNQIPGYNQLTCTLSTLGVSSSPVAKYVSIWSVILGLIFVFFGYIIRNVFHSYGKTAMLASWLIMLYAFGEDIAAGILRDEHVNGKLTDMAILHDLVGGVGIIALLILPLVMIKIFSRKTSPLLYYFSLIVLSTGVLSIILFSFRIDYFDHTFLNTYSGIWQRCFLINYYCYFIAIAIAVLKK